MSQQIKDLFLNHLPIRECYICKEDYWRIIHSQVMEDPQDKTRICIMEYICQKCGTKEKRQIEFSDTIT